MTSLENSLLGPIGLAMMREDAVVSREAINSPVRPVGGFPLAPRDSSRQDPSVFLAHSKPEQVVHVAKTLFLTIAQDLALSTPEQARVLGFADVQSFSENFLDKRDAIHEALLARISHLWNIHRAMVTLAPLPSHGTWIRHANKTSRGLLAARYHVA